MRHFFKLLLLSLFISQASFAMENTIDDMFNVKEVNGKTAIAEGKVKSLKAGDKIYFVRSPFVFNITAVKGNQITVEVPANSDLAAGMSLVRNPTDAIKKGIDTEAKLKQALQE